MQIICPACSSRYELDAAKLGPAGRKVRCASCKTLWHVEPIADFPVTPDGDETQALLREEIARAAAIDQQITAIATERQAGDDDSPPETEPTTLPPMGDAESDVVAPSGGNRRKRDGKRGRRASVPGLGATRRLALPACVTLCGLALFGILFWQREAAVRTAPQLAGLFERLGMPVNVRGLNLGSVESALLDDGLGRFLVVEGDITNITRHISAVPSIEVAVKDAGGQTLYTWTTAPPRPSLEPAELAHFRARLASPPENGRTVEVRFASGKPPGLASAR